MSTTKRVLLWLMGFFYMYAGYMHFRRPDFYEPMMPPYLPAPMFLIYLSGVAEFVSGLGVLIPPTRKVAAWLMIATLIAVFPANIHIAVHNVALFGNPEGAGPLNWVRLPLQAVLIAWAWWYTFDDAATQL